MCYYYRFFLITLRPIAKTKHICVEFTCIMYIFHINITNMLFKLARISGINMFVNKAWNIMLNYWQKSTYIKIWLYNTSVIGINSNRSIDQLGVTLNSNNWLKTKINISFSVSLSLASGLKNLCQIQYVCG